MFGHETNAGCGARSGSRSVRCGREAPHGVLQTAVNTEINLKSEVDTREGRVLETLGWAGLGWAGPCPTREPAHESSGCPFELGKDKARGFAGNSCSVPR